MMGLDLTKKVGKEFFENLAESGAMPLLTETSGLLSEFDVRGYVVGGFVRDTLLGRTTLDIDIAVATDALEVACRVADALNSKYVLLDETFGVARVIVTGVHAVDEPWQLDFSSYEGDIEQDLARRDFTIDAMAIDIDQLIKDSRSVRLIDPFNGCEDLDRGVVRSVSESAFEADTVRLLRAVRLAAELGFSVDCDTEVQISQYAHQVSSVAGERVREELLRLLVVPESGQFIAYMDKLGLLTAVLPELDVLKGVEQPKEHFWDVFDHSLEMVVAVDFLLREGGWEHANGELLSTIPWSTELARHFEQEVSSGSTGGALLRLAALLHDIAKPQTKAIEPDGRMRFLGHAQEGALLTAAILERLRFSTKEIRLVETMVKYHLRPMQMSQGGLPTHRAIYRYFRDAGEAGIDTLFLSLADHLATRGPHLDRAGWQEHTHIVDYVLKQYYGQQSQVRPVKLVDGHDLINIFGLSSGPGLGELLEAVREAQAVGEVTTREDALEYVRGRLSTEESR
ncbi:MAG: CCA tRNA nucleotidyltransferase [Dehalococcoidales bacterium]|nr:MAG: CCA tRNA nucleotidyltransferase [Dehalococcoidales bacterium]